MSEQKGKIMALLHDLLRLSSCDFALVAPISDGETRIRWLYAAGNRNDRYASMVVKPGHGLAGEALRSGRRVIRNVEEVASDLTVRRCPVMLAETLLAAAVFPVPNFAGGLGGLLYVGRRRAVSITGEEIRRIEEQLAEIGALLKGNQARISK